MNLNDLAIELFCRFDPDKRGYITQDQLLKTSVNDSSFSEGQIISVFSLLDKDEKGVITLSDFTDAFVDVSEQTINQCEEMTCNITRSSDEKDNGSSNNDSENNNSTETCECPCKKSFKCPSRLKIRCCMYDRSLRSYRSSDFFCNDSPCKIKRKSGPPKSSLKRRGSLPTLFMRRREDNPKTNLLKSKRWKSYDYGINFFTLEETEETDNVIRNETSTPNIRNAKDIYKRRDLLSNSAMYTKYSLAPNDVFYSDINQDMSSKELDDIFGSTDKTFSFKTGCEKCNSNRKSSNGDGNLHILPKNDFTDFGIRQKYNFENSVNEQEPTENGLDKLCYDPYKYKNGGKIKPLGKKNGYVTGNVNSTSNFTKRETFISEVGDSGRNVDRTGDAVVLGEEWEGYLRRIQGTSLFLWNHTLQYLWQQIKLYQSDLASPFENFLKGVIEDQKAAYGKCQETEDTLHLKTEQHEKEISSLYEEFEITREKEVKNFEKKQYDREEYLKSEFRKIIDYKEQAYQEVCKQMADASERLEGYEEEIASLQAKKKKAEAQCKLLLEEQQRNLTENRHMMLENEVLKQKYVACTTSVTDLQDYLKQLKTAADEEKTKHRSFMQQYNDIMDEKTFLETSLANLSMENTELRNKSYHKLTEVEGLNYTAEISHLPISTSSPVKNNYIKNLNNNYQVMSLHEELNSSFGENKYSVEDSLAEETAEESNTSSKYTSSKCNSSKSTSSKSTSSISTSNKSTSIGTTCSKSTSKGENSRTSENGSFCLTHHFIQCDRLSISNIVDDVVLHSSNLTSCDPLFKHAEQHIDSETTKITLEERHINLATPYQSDFKIIFCGNSNVGKTSLICRICFGAYEPSPKKTILLDTYTKNVESSGQTFKLKLWDTVGQERFNSLPHSYYRKSDVAVIMYDITENNSFESMKLWLENVQKYSDDVSVIILGSKVDLNSSRKISKKIGERFAKENDAIFMETSAKTGENIDKLLYLITMKLLDQNEFVLIQNYFEQSASSSPKRKPCCNN